MQLIKNREFGGERPLFASHDLHLDNVTILAGESAIKECSNIVAVNCRFEGNYPFWHVHGFTIENCYFAVGGRSALWYSDHLKMKDTVIDAPKMFREMSEIDIENVVMNDADEVFWRCSGIRVKNLKLHEGTYPFMFSRDIIVDGLESDSKYVFQYVKNAEIHNARITTKDAFWEVENVTIYDSVLDGEYLGWHSRNLRLVNCHISGEQPLCYAHDLVLENCTFDAACDRAFEYSTLRADIRGSITNIKNPTSGLIVADSIGSVTRRHPTPEAWCSGRCAGGREVPRKRSTDAAHRPPTPPDGKPPGRRHTCRHAIYLLLYLLPMSDAPCREAGRPRP